MADEQFLDRLRFGTHAIVDLDAYARNIRALIAMLPTGVSFMAVVKADAYGHGASECAAAALRAGAGWLGVARTDEALRLRRAGVAGPLLVLGPPNPLDLADAIASGVTVTVGAQASARAVIDAAQASASSASVHLKIDTGMHRYGFMPADAAGIARRLAAAPNVELAGVYTHFAAADELDAAPTARQLERFDAALDELASVGLRPYWVHAANSAGILSGRLGPVNLARAGIATFGLSPSSEAPVGPGFSPVLSVKTRLTRVFELPAGEGVSYGLTYRAAHDERLGATPIGYADGLPRALSNVGAFGIHGGRRAIRGRVCMDQTVVSVPDDAREGDVVDVLGGDGMSADEIGRLADTLNYEVVARLAARVPRLYMEGGRVVSWRVPADCAFGRCD